MSSRVSTGRRNAVIGLSIASLAGVAALSGVVATSANAAIDPLAYNNVVTIQTTNRAVSVTQYRGALGPVSETFATAKQGCAMVPGTTATGDVVDFGGTATVGFNSGSIGIIEKSGSGQACGQVNFLSSTEEALTISLKGGLANVAALDMEVQKDARIVATTFSGTTQLNTFELQSGASVGTETSADQTFICNVATSSAPNSNITDNCRWLFGGLSSFDSVTLQALRGQFSLEGGADGAVPLAPGEPTDVPSNNVSYFKLGEICTDINTSTTIASTGGANYPTGTVKRYTNADNSICFDDELKANAADANTVNIIKKGQPYAQYVTRISWEKNPTTAAASSPAVSQTTIEFDQGGGQLGPVNILPWCPTSLFDSSTSAAGVDDPDTSVDESTDRYLTLPSTVTSGGLTATELRAYNVTDMDGLGTNSVQFACILDRDVNYDAGTFYVNDVIYVLGDLRMRG